MNLHAPNCLLLANLVTFPPIVPSGHALRLLPAQLCSVMHFFIAYLLARECFRHQSGAHYDETKFS